MRKHSGHVRAFLFVLAALLAAAALILPFPQRIKHTLNGVIAPAEGSGEAEACTVILDGVCYRYLLRDDEYVGRFAISALPYTVGNYDLHACGESGRINFLSYLTDDGYRNAGYYLTPDGFASLYARIEGTDSLEYHLAAPAADEAGLQDYIRRIESHREFPLPS